MKLKVYYLTNGSKSAMVEALDKNMAYGKFLAKIDIFPTPTEISKVQILEVFAPDSDELKKVVMANNVPLYKMTAKELDMARYKNMSAEELEPKMLKLIDAVLDTAIGSMMREEDEEDSVQEEDEEANTDEEDNKEMLLSELIREQEAVCAEIMRLKKRNNEIVRQIKEILE